jgi:Family of unknown function (DUF6527)
MSLRLRLLSPKICIVYDPLGRNKEPPELHCHYCPACNKLHGFYVNYENESGTKWSYNEDHMSPTFEPPLKILTINPSNGETEICHYAIKNGVITYATDSTHALAGKTGKLPDIPYKAIMHAEIIKDDESPNSGKSKKYFDYL